jgi:Pe-pgrs family protein
MFVFQAGRAAAFDGGNQAVGRAQVYADGEAVLVGGGGFAGFGDLE